ncbi:hypothetical protein BDN67DRAFT_984165 [Paxillus ammoniavirescens]|nr:hypothetical protein BDN67DRAFT_984165 [Paxillus ammoniavirescens]
MAISLCNGRFEVECPTPLSYEAHAAWAIQYADQHFCLDLQFMFQVFGVIQKQQVCRICSFVWGLTVKMGPPSLWITINPADIHDPVAQVFTGVKIDLDHFDQTAGPDSTLHSIHITQDPYAALKFFHFTICAVIDSLFGIYSAHKGSTLRRKIGIFGIVEGYIGTVEAQG